MNLSEFVILSLSNNITAETDKYIMSLVLSDLTIYVYLEDFDNGHVDTLESVLFGIYGCDAQR